MAPTYGPATINARLQAVANQIDAGPSNGFLVLISNSTIISTIQLARPCGFVSGQVLTFLGTLLDPAAVGTGLLTTGQFTDSTGTVVASGLSVGIPAQTADIIIANGLNTRLITAGQTVQVLAASITGS